MRVHGGQKITLRNSKSAREIECSITSVETLPNGTHQAEIQFNHPQPDFWPVQFPPDAANTPFQHAAEVNLRTEPALISSSESLGTSDARPANKNVSFASNHSAPIRPEPLAASVDARPAIGTATQQFSSSVARDSVAQFRAANRAAYRRQQQLKFAYGVLALIALAAAVVFGRPYLQRRAEATSTPVETAAVVVERPHIRVQRGSAVAGPPVVAQAVVAISSAVQPRSASETAAPVPPVSEAPSQPTAEASFHPNAADLARSEAEKASPREISVHHTAAAPQSAGGSVNDEPIAFPVKLADNSGSTGGAPPMIGDLVSSGTHTPAVLAAQPMKKVTPLKLISSVSAGYPALARQYRVEGQVVVLAEVDKTGTVVATKALSGPPMLRQSAADAVRKWKYRPAMLDDKPVPSTDTITLSFKVH
jgi:protein TonB